MKRRRIKPMYNPVNLDTLNSASKSIEREDYHQLYNTCYLFGLRITEALALTPKNITKERYETRNVYVAEIATLKNKKYPIRYPVAWDRGLEGIIAQELYLYAQAKDPEDYIFRGLTRQVAWHEFKKAVVKMTGVTLYPRELITETRGVFPHYLRHCRASDLVNIYGFNELQLMIYMGWSDPKLSATYVKSDWKALAKKGHDVYAEFT